MTELTPLPCPFCGGTDISTHEGTSFRWQVAECMTCGAQGSEVRRQTLGQGTTDLWIKQAAADAITEWNTRAALTQPEPEPAAKMREMLDVQGRDGTWNYDPYFHGMYNGMEFMLAMVESREPVFRSSPVKWLGYTAPPQREWQGLTDKTYWEMWVESPSDVLRFAHAIEAKLREKNG